MPKTSHAIPAAVCCSQCKKVGIAFFEGGFNVKVADKVMNHQVIRGDCGYCKRTNVELIPIPNLTEADQKELYQLYQIQKTLQAAADRGWNIPKKALVLPLKKVEEFHRKWAQRAEETP